MSTFDFNKFNNSPIVGILRNYSWDEIQFIAEAFCAAELSTLEITLNTPNALDYIEKLIKLYPSLNIGAGTVCTLPQLSQSIGSGVSFVVTPILDLDIIAEAKKNDIAIFPGAFSPTECYQAWQAGADAVKVFPATILGPRFVQDMRGPLPQIKLIPTGGISKENMAEYKKAGAFGYGMGGSLFNREYLDSRNMAQLVEYFKGLASIISE